MSDATTVTVEDMTLLGRTSKSDILVVSMKYSVTSEPTRFFITDCCGGATTYSGDGAHCCKGCWYEVDEYLGGVYDAARDGSLIPPTDEDVAIFMRGFLPKRTSA